MSTETVTEKICFYKVLEIEKTASEEEIKKAYTKLALKHHPDRNLENQEEANKKFQEIAEAYEVLKNQARRKLYDQHGHAGLKSDLGPPQPDIDPNEVFRAFFSAFHPGFGNGGFSYATTYSSEDISSEDDEFSFFGFGNPFMPDYESDEDEYYNHKRRRPEPVKHKLDVSLEDIVKQRTKKLKITRSRQRKKGKIVEEEKILEIPLKNVVKDGGEIVFEEEGDQIYGQTPQDILIQLRVKPHDLYTVSDRNVVHEKRISLFEALKGDFTFELKSLTGEDIEIKAPSIIKPGTVKIILGEGLPSRSGRGNLIVKYIVEFPAELTEEQRRLLPQVLPH